MGRERDGPIIIMCYQYFINRAKVSRLVGNNLNPPQTYTLFYRYGNCVPYVTSRGGGPCDTEFEIGVDYVYIPYTRLNGNITELNLVLETFNFFFSELLSDCMPIVLRGLCFYYYPPCGNSTHFVPPPALCHDDCVAAQTELCLNQYIALHSYIANTVTTDLEAIGLNIVNCSDPGEFVNPLPHCCYTAIGKCSTIFIVKYIICMLKINPVHRSRLSGAVWV